MKNLFIVIAIFFNLILAGCTAQTDSAPSTQSILHTFNNILKEHYSNQIRSLGLVNAYMNGVTQLKENPEKQMFYLGQLSTAREQLNTLVTLDTVSY